MFNRRIQKELKNIEHYCYYLDEKKMNFNFNTTHGILKINITSSYPFSQPKVTIINNLEKIKINNYELNYYLNKLFNEDISNKISNHLQFLYKNEEIHIKKYFYECLNLYEKKHKYNIIDDFDNSLLNWNPVKNIKFILEFLENTNKLYNIKEKHQFKFISF